MDKPNALPNIAGAAERKRRHCDGSAPATAVAAHTEPTAEPRAAPEQDADAGDAEPAAESDGPTTGTEPRRSGGPTHDPSTAAVVQTSAGHPTAEATTAATATAAAATAVSATERSSLISAKASPDSTAAHVLQQHVLGSTVSADAGFEADAAARTVAARRHGTPSGRHLGAAASVDAQREKSAADKEPATESVAEARAESEEPARALAARLGDVGNAPGTEPHGGLASVGVADGAGTGVGRRTADDAPRPAEQVCGPALVVKCTNVQ